VNNYVAPTLKVERVSSVLHVSVSNTNTTPAPVVMLKYFTFSCYYMCQRVCVCVVCGVRECLAKGNFLISPAV
jgi:hypothetical protein